MSIATDVSRIKGNITAALAAIANKGVTVPDGSTSDALAALIESIETGGGGAGIVTGSFTINSSNLYRKTITHGLGAIPKMVIVLWDDISLDSIQGTNSYICGFAYQDGEFNDSVKMISTNIVYKKTYEGFIYCSKTNDVMYYNGFDIRSGSPGEYCSIYDVNENTFSVDTRLDRIAKPSDRYFFAFGGTYKWIAI